MKCDQCWALSKPKWGVTDLGSKSATRASDVQDIERLCRHQDRLPLVSRGEDTRLLFKLWLPVLCRVSAQKVHGVHGQCVDSYQLDELPRLTLWVVLCEYEGSLNVMGPNCNSWTLPARGTTIRNYVNIHGAMHLRFVEEGNRCISRCLSPNNQLT